MRDVSSVEAFCIVYGESAASDVIIKPYPRLTALHKYVMALPEIAAFKAGPNYKVFPAGNVAKAYVKNVRSVLV